MRHLKTYGVPLGIALLTLTGCGSQPHHPNQLNTFDGASYDSLTAAHAALASLRPAIAANFPQYSGAFNDAAASYTVAYNAYTAYRSAPTDETALIVALNNLTVSVVSIENTFQVGMHIAPNTVLQARVRAGKLKAAAQRQHISLSDILTELEIAASIAESVPGAQPYATLAALVIKATESAIAAVSASSAQLIDLSTITPIPSI